MYEVLCGSVTFALFPKPVHQSFIYIPPVTTPQCHPKGHHGHRAHGMVCEETSTTNKAAVWLDPDTWSGHLSEVWEGICFLSSLCSLSPPNTSSESSERGTLGALHLSGILGPHCPMAHVGSCLSLVYSPLTRASCPSPCLRPKQVMGAENLYYLVQIPHQLGICPLLTGATWRGSCGMRVWEAVSMGQGVAV